MPHRRRLYERKEITRHGKTVWYFRRPGEKRIRLKGEYNSPEYAAAYEAALRGTPTHVGVGKQNLGTLSWLVGRYKAAAYSGLADITKQDRDYIYADVCKLAGHAQFDAITRRHIQDAMSKKKPHAAAHFLSAMRVLFKWAVENEHATENPCIGVRMPKRKVIGYRTWTIEDVECFRQHHPVGTKPRLALELLLFTGLRRSDVILAGRQHFRNGTLSIRTRKTGATVHLPIFAELSSAISTAATGDLTFLTNREGNPFPNPQAFGTWFIKQVRAAGLTPGLSAHGLRKAGATIAADNGATIHELMAMYGWTKMAQAEVYTREADKRRLARGAAERIANNARPRLEKRSLDNG